MGDLTARLADLFRRYQVEFVRMAHMSDAECDQATEPFQKEISILGAIW
jgi:hypothetical protein